MKAIFTAALMLLVAGAHAAQLQDCRDVYDAAYVVMQDRQDGVPLPEMLEVAGSARDKTDRRILQNLVADAYEGPIYSTRPYQHAAVEEFANRAMLACLRR